MSTTATIGAGQNLLFRAGWIVLIASAALMTLNHFVLIFYLDDPVLFLGWTAFTLYALLVVVIPLRRLERWAWYATWILPIGLAAGGFSAPDIAMFYFAVAAACVVGLLFTMRDLFSKEVSR